MHVGLYKPKINLVQLYDSIKMSTNQLSVCKYINTVCFYPAAKMRFEYIYLLIYRLIYINMNLQLKKDQFR